MRRRLCALLLAAGLLLSGCASMLNNDYVDVKPHAEHLEAGGDLSDLRAENYKQLVDILCEMVVQGVSRGVIRLADYKPRSADSDVETELSAACEEVTHEDPLGAYAVDYIRHETTYIVSYYEANLYISYRRSQNQIQSVIPVIGKSAMRKTLEESLSNFQGETVLRVNSFTGDEDEVRELVREAYYDTPSAALGMPDIQVSLYPKGVEDPEGVNRQRVVEILLRYPDEKGRMERQREALLEEAQILSGRLTAMEADRAAQTAYYTLRQSVEYVLRISGRQISTAYAAIVEKRADSEGIALAYQLYCQNAGIESTIVSGSLNGARHSWNIIRLKNGEYRHVDVTQADGFTLEDADMAARGYRWQQEDYPICGRQPEAAPETEEPSVEPSGEPSDGEEKPSESVEDGRQGPKGPLEDIA